MKNLLHYPYLQIDEIRFIGSVAKQFEEIIREIGKDLNLKIGSITASPLEGLIKYHMS